MPPPRPYIFAPLEVVYHHLNVKIDGQIATTSVDQEFYNPNPRQLEGTFLFPVPKGAQINKFTMEINGKQVEAELLAADKARGIYEDIVRRAKDPALLEYAGRDLFKVRLFPIEGHGRKKITEAVQKQIAELDFAPGFQMGHPGAFRLAQDCDRSSSRRNALTNRLHAMRVNGSHANGTAARRRRTPACSVRSIAR